uniref:Solute carrier family 7 member 13 n=1 Tax=Steinernema glaseri TaxID=37863 RepID=A0A1I7Z3M3_9BILA
MVNHNKMGLLGAISYIIGNIVGSGIFITPTSILDKTDSVGLSLIIWSVSALISILGAFCYVELGTSIRTSGADFAYLCYVKWYPLAFAFMCAGCILTYPATLAVQAQTFTEYVFKGCGSYCETESELEMYFAKKLLAFALIWILMFMNFFSVKRLVQYFQIGASIAKVAATAIIVITGFYYLIVKGETKNLEDPFPASTKLAAGTLVSALFAGLFSYDGWDILNFGAEEIENPKRTMPLAIIIGLIIVAVIYVATNISYFVILTITEIKSAEAVATTFALKALGKFHYAVPFLICIVLVGSLNSTMFSASRYLHAAARQGVIPSWISCTNRKEDSPRAALFLHILLSIAISFVGDLDSLIGYLAFAQWSQRMFTMMALMWIRYKHKPVHPDAITTPFFVPVIFFFVCTALVVVTIVQTYTVAAVGGGICIGGFIFYMIFIYERSLHSFEGYRNFLHKLNHVTSVFAQISFNAMVDVHAEGEDQLLEEVPSSNDLEGENKNKVAPLQELSPRSFASSISTLDGDLKKFS